MKKPLVQITKGDIEKALANTVWDLGNQVLYDLCSKYPLHKTPQEILAKVWLIGRSYAAALERRKNKSSDSLGDLFYEDKAAPEIKKSKIDDWLELLKSNSTPETAIETHSKLTNLFFKISKLEKRSLASKYLHFHRQNLFFIYDSRAMSAIRSVTPGNGQLPTLVVEESDKEYASFYRRCLWPQDDLEKQYGYKLSPRELDKLLLYITDSRKT
jgi:hypothetical protein